MNIPIKSILIFCAVLFFICIIIFNPNEFEWINNNLQKTANIISFLSMLFTILAFGIAIMAYRAATLRPKLQLRVTPWSSEDGVLALHVNPVTNQIPSYRPYTSWEIWLDNVGDAAAKYVVVEISFEGMFFSENKLGSVFKL